MDNLTKQQRHKMRRRQGIRVYQLALPEELVEDALVFAGHLSLFEADDRQKVEAALQRFVESLVTIDIGGDR